MSTIKQITIDSAVQSTCAVMDWLKDNQYPMCCSTVISLINGEYGGIISSYSPDSFELDWWGVNKENAKKYNGMFRLCTSECSWKFYMPEVQRYYFMSI